MASPPNPFPAPAPGAFQPGPPMRAPKPRIWLHALLFVAAICTTWYAYYWQMFGGNLLAPPKILFPPFAWIAVQYSFWVLLILTAHELGHYFMAKRHKVMATLPFFIPLPLPPLGTMGAVIRMSPFIPSRRALFDIAVAGPLAGMAVAAPVIFWGIRDATRVPMQQVGVLHFGDPLLFRIAEWMVLGPRSEGQEILIGPMVFAGWVGLFVTALNLLPMSQLDGGHISYAVFGRGSRKLAILVYGSLIVAMLLQIVGPTYILFLVLVWMVGIGHPPTMNDGLQLDAKRKAVAVLALIVFILSFTPFPVT